MQLEMFNYLPHNEGTSYKTCNSCSQDKPEESFYVQYHRKDGTPTRGNVCVQCKTDQSRLRVELRKSAGPPPDRCTCCGTSSEVVIDHCHDTLAFRGWLCHKCNVGIGLLGDTVEGTQKAVQYLKRANDER